MKLDFLMVADAVEVGDDRKLTIVGAGVSHVQVAELPTRISRLAAVSRFLLEEQDPEASEPFLIQLRVVAPDDTVAGVSRREMEPEATRRPRFHEGEEHAAFFIVTLDGIELSLAGTYRLELALRDEVVGERPLAVVLGAGGAREPA